MDDNKLKEYITESHARMVTLREIAEESKRHGLRLTLGSGDKRMELTPYESSTVIEQLANIIIAPYAGGMVID